MADLVAPSGEALPGQLDGRRVVVGPADAPAQGRAAHGRGSYGPPRPRIPGRRTADAGEPGTRHIFLSIGTLAVIYELAGPGMGFAGIIGVILLILGFTSLSVLPFNTAGLLLLLLAAALFVGEVLTPGIGLFAADGRRH
ncbi:hypothetical protein I5Q34_27820 [Streptomyces sp. AV19]|uniref:hypothetical protein n=1 Tax=Streptomyces sp. AV19 TaxID=2793068 RepID=UPI0018FE33F9|nr:hypothetical protein [Streptomyces sp. AV19]MBH1938032.1 hypothetical protein [Streptomyces sp. AV19]MDG4536645.1 hypothetical protein [Streptomyces sp. AV19]